LAAHLLCSLPQITEETQNNIRRMSTQWKVQHISTDTKHQHKSSHWFTADVKKIYFKIRKIFQTKKLESLFMRMADYRTRNWLVINHVVLCLKRRLSTIWFLIYVEFSRQSGHFWDATAFWRFTNCWTLCDAESQ
jgi:thiamine biosynthesis lipoprotein ApbE